MMTRLLCHRFTGVAFCWLCIPPILHLQAQSGMPLDESTVQLPLVISDQQVREIRGKILYAASVQELNSANAVRRAYEATVTGWLDIGSTIDDSLAERNAELKARVQDAVPLPCLMILALDHDREIARAAQKQEEKSGQVSITYKYAID